MGGLFFPPSSLLESARRQKIFQSFDTLPADKLSLHGTSGDITYCASVFPTSRCFSFNPHRAIGLTTHLVAHTAQRATPSIKSTKIPVRFANKKTRDTERVLAHNDHCRPPYPHPIFVSQGSHISTNPDHLTLSGGDNTMFAMKSSSKGQPQGVASCPEALLRL
uniref:Uncharacterized protein n=1 Tax=Coccidioides posadasii RMSCC 3488 TaxID=454284 RepID=A0A0J6FLV8_COCPO|nr:hypothetical protein CPAG_06717 [Coccidioides posadasii RMSCC 3488]